MRRRLTELLATRSRRLEARHVAVTVPSPVEDPQTVKLRDVATLVGAAALGGNLREAPRIPTR